MPKATIIQTIHDTLMTIFIKYKDSIDGSYDEDGGLLLEEALNESIDSETDAGDFGSISLQGNYQLKLSPSLDERLLRLLLQMTMGMNTAIKQLVQELLERKNPSLLKAITKAMEKGIQGAELVLSEVLEKSSQQELSLFMDVIREASPSVEDTLSRSKFNPTFKLTPKKPTDLF